MSIFFSSSHPEWNFGGLGAQRSTSHFLQTMLDLCHEGPTLLVSSCCPKGTHGIPDTLLTLYPLDRAPVHCLFWVEHRMGSVRHFHYSDQHIIFMHSALLVDEGKDTIV